MRLLFLLRVLFLPLASRTDRPDHVRMHLRLMKPAGVMVYIVDQNSALCPVVGAQGSLSHDQCAPTQMRVPFFRWDGFVVLVPKVLLLELCGPMVEDILSVIWQYTRNWTTVQRSRSFQESSAITSSRQRA
ncbi:hypothetical protein DFJ58DRAFT_754317 [Suillus subalutaceus]|uniref:uncharacterized protein n=1 Tax=Suillus subalutaceus TaxID=48586 RepID=UPI001B875BF0|nr:uncharacterized protein DFJ58DRAFT_754317 [Suillus subalutaceus]KAG1876445.1 hypothetical protein DFJ58DRAFT_754317 [Suillus subalutaceus]